MLSLQFSDPLSVFPKRTIAAAPSFVRPKDWTSASTSSSVLGLLGGIVYYVRVQINGREEKR